ncbi:MAG: radical SAM/SPASM domain-containing protein [Promethearchaeota archaeon]
MALEEELDQDAIEEAKRQWHGVPLSFDQEKMIKWYTHERGGARGGADVFYLMFGITYNCQLKCPHCCVGNYENEPPRELTTEEIKDVLDQSAKAFAINFFGGEPTLREDLMELIKYASERSVYVFCDTNGIKITKDYARQLKDNGLEILYVSIDSPHPEIHDELRGMKGLFDIATQGIKNALEVGLNCQLSTYITKENLANGNFERVIQLARDLNATGVRYLLPTPTGRWLYKLDVMLTPEEKKKVRKIAKFPYVVRDFYFQNQTSSQCAGMSGHAYFYISPYGDVMPCCFIPLTFGNIREEPLKTILERMWGHGMFSEDWVNRECPMLNAEYRKKYIDSIPSGTKLPFRIC